MSSTMSHSPRRSERIMLLIEKKKKSSSSNFNKKDIQDLVKIFQNITLDIEFTNRKKDLLDDIIKDFTLKTNLCNKILPGESKTIIGKTGTYIISKDQSQPNIIKCSCPSWTFSKTKTCKHSVMFE